MTCYHPKDAWRVSYPEYAGYIIVFSLPEHQKNQFEKLQFPCRRCIGCRLAASRDWTVRIMHEAKMHEISTFLTLTYDPTNLPRDGSICTEHPQKFIKKLRRQLSPKIIRHFTVGEYGDEYGRPHYHSVIFGYDFPDKRRHKHDPNTNSWLYTSEELTKTWAKGHATVQHLSLGGAAYIARYVTKKLDGEMLSKYEGKKPEFALMSRKPGIGRTWFEKYHTSAFPSDFVIINGKRFPVPAYYDRLHADMNPAEHMDVIDWRSYDAKFKTNESDRTPERLAVREAYQHLIRKDVKRSL